MSVEITEADQSLLEMLEDFLTHDSEGPRLHEEAVCLLAKHRSTSTEEVERLRAERDFLLARSGHAGSVRFGDKDRWTGASSNAIVSIAFGGTGSELPFDSSDLAACYRAIMRLPDHLRTDAVFDQLERGEQAIGAESVEKARAASSWPGRTALTGASNHVG